MKDLRNQKWFRTIGLLAIGIVGLDLLAALVVVVAAWWLRGL